MVRKILSIIYGNGLNKRGTILNQVDGCNSLMTMTKRVFDVNILFF